MDKLRQFVNGLFITVYVIVGIVLFGLITIRDGNEAQGLHLFEVCAPYIIDTLGISFVLHIFLTNVILAPKAYR